MGNPTDARDTDNPAAARPRKGRLRRALLISGASVVVLVLASAAALAFFGPRIAASYAKSAIPGLARQSIAGPVTVDEIRLSWAGPQTIRGLKIRDPKGELVADVAIEATTNLRSLVFGSRDIGVITISGAATFAKDAEKTNLQRALEPSPAAAAKSAAPAPPGAGPTRLPATLAGKIVIDALAITYTDNSAPSDDGAVRSASIPALRGEASFAVGQPLVFTLNGDGTVDGRPTRLSADINVSNLTAPDGLLTPELLTVDATIDASLPSALLAALPVSASVSPVLEAVFAPGAGASDTTLAVRATGDAKRIDSTIVARAPGGAIDGAFQVVNIAGAPGQTAGRIATTRPMTAEFSITPRLAERLQAGADGARTPSAALDAPIRAGATLELDAPLPSGGAMDLRGAMVRATLSLSEARGTVMLPGEAGPTPFTVAPLSATMDAPDLAGPLTITAGTEATLDGRRAGVFAADVRASGLLDDRGAPKPGMLAGLSGSVELTGFATAIAQPFVAGAGLDLLRDVGPTLDVKVAAAARPGVGGASPAPGAEFTATARSRNVSVDATLSADENGVRTTGEGAVVKIADAAPTIAAFLADSGVRAQGPTPATLRITALDAPLSAGEQGRAVNPAHVRLTARLEAGALTATMRDDPTPLTLSALDADVALAPGAPAKVVLAGAGAFGADPFTLSGDIGVAELFGKDGKVNAAARPTGTVKVVDAPISLAGLAGMGEQVALLKHAIGPKLNIDLVASGAEGGASDVNANISAANLTADASARLRSDRIEVHGIKAKTTLTPGLLNAALDQYAPTMTERPALLAPAEVSARVGAMQIPIKVGKADLANATPIKAGVTIEGEGARIRGVPVAGQAPLEALLKGFRGDATWSLAEGGPREVSASAELIDTATAAAFGAFDASAKLLPGGALDASATLDRLDTAKVDSVLGRPGLLAGALGPSASVTATARPQGGAKGGADASMAIAAKVTSPKLTTEASLVADPQKIALTKPLELQWTVEPAWAETHLMGGALSAAGGSQRRASASLAAPVSLSARVDRLVISRAAGAPLKPGVFDIAAKVSSPNVAIQAAGQSAALMGVQMGLNSTGAGALAFDFSIAEVRSAGGAEPGASTARGTIRGFADANGAPTPGLATIDAEVDGRMPTAIIDALSGREGMLTEGFGPMVGVRATAQNLSRTAGAVNATVKADRAEANLKGRVDQGVFYGEEPAVVRVLAITPEFARMTFEAAMPLLSNLEKRPEDGPAVATVRSLETPLFPEVDTNGDGTPDEMDLRKLSGDLRLELGQMRYTSSNLLGSVLKATKNKAEGKLFRRFPPIDVSVRNGVASYDRTRFPIGEFEIETRGKVDLAERHMDLIVYLPLLAVADEVASVFKLTPGLGEMTMIPFRIKGRVGEAIPVPAPDLVAKEMLQSPEKILEGAGNILNDLLKKKK